MDNRKKADKIYYHQAMLLVIVLRIILGLTYLPELNTPPANQDIWIMLLLSILYTVVFSLPLLYLGNKFSQYSFYEYAEMIMGKFIGKVINIFYGLFFFMFLIFFSSVFIEILNSSLYDETPTIINITILMITSTYIVYKGIMNLARLGELVIPFILLLFFLLAILGFENYDFKMLLPILSDSKLADINKGALISSLRNTDSLILIMLIPYLEEKKDVNKIFIKSLIYSIFIVILTVIIVQATLGIEYTKLVNFPFYNFSRLIKIGETQGFDLLYVVSWIMGNVIKVSSYHYFTTVALGKVANKRNQIFIIPAAVVNIIAVILLKDRRPIIAVKDPFPQIFIVSTVLGIIIIPLILFIVYLFRRNKIEQSSNSNKN